MYNLESVFQSLMNVLEANLHSPRADYWAIYFNFWRYSYSLNQNLEESNNLDEKINMIVTFYEHSKHFEAFEVALLERGKVAKDDLPDVDTIGLSPHLEKMRELQAKEASRTEKLIKEIRKLKFPKENEEKPTRRRPARQKWIRS